MYHYRVLFRHSQAAPAVERPTTISAPLVLPSLKTFQHRIARHILPIPPAPAAFDQRVVDVGAIEQEHVSKDAPVLVLAVGLERDVFTEDEC